MGPAMTQRRGFTLLEVLAAVVALAMLAAAAMPLVVHLARSRIGIEERLSASSLLDRRVAGIETEGAIADGPVPDHDGWWFRSTRLRRSEFRSGLPTDWSRSYVVIDVVDGSAADAHVLAQRVLVEPADRP
jgi:prepilin-type N-terminal cleavage/methylation domain-containing protein